MKHLLAILLLVLLAALPASADSVRLKGDTLVAISDTDSVVINTKDLTRTLSGAISDTLSPTVQAAADTYDAQQAADNLRELELTQHTVVAIVAIVGFIILLLILLALIFWYMHRRAKYRMMEKAIENNYPLYPQVQQPAAPQPMQPQYYQPQPVQPEQPQAQPQPQPQPQPAYGTGRFDGINFNTKQFRSAFVLLAVGVALVLFFVLNDVWGMAGLMMMMVFFGLGKGFLAYQEQRNFQQQQAWQQNAWRQQAQQQQGQQQPPKFDHPQDQQPQA